ncbi:MAG: NUDIX domain-containing protein [Ilumatobacteraceae bacterium]
MTRRPPQPQQPGGDAEPDLTGLRIREAVRALLLTPGREVLLVRFEFPGGTRWALPGGGLDPGETHLDALHRELDEELGLTALDVGPHVWTRTHIIPFVNGRWDGQRERVHLVPTERFDPAPRLSAEQLAAEYLFEIRWWHVDDITDGLPFVPMTLATHLRDLERHGPPAEPWRVGV